MDGVWGRIRYNRGDYPCTQALRGRKEEPGIHSLRMHQLKYSHVTMQQTVYHNAYDAGHEW